MTTCERYAEGESAERYVAGRMTADQAADFEHHFLGCDKCLEMVRSVEDVRDVLADRRAAIARGEADPLTAPGLDAPPMPQLTPAQRKSMSWTSATWLAVAAAVLAAIGWMIGGGLARLGSRGASGTPGASVPAVARITTPPQPSSAPNQAPSVSTPGQTQAGTPSATPAPPAQSPEGPGGSGSGSGTGPTALIARLAIVIPPPYVAVPVRGEGESVQQEFATAMARYRVGDYAAAETGLREIVARTPDLAAVQFYLGICELMARQPRRAEVALKAAAASEETPYADEAYFYLAKAALQRGDLTAAERALTEAVAREAGPGQEATRILEEVRALGRS